MLPVIGVMIRLERKQPFSQLELHQEYVDAIIESGGDPLLLFEGSVWSHKEKKRLFRWLKQCDGIVITGGDQPSSWDYYVLDYAMKHHLPVLGICLGMQVMATYRNQEKLYLLSSNSHKQIGKKYVHDVQLEPNSKLFYLFGKQSTIEVNSRHMECVKTGGMFTVSGKSEDGIVECLENPNHEFQIGVQWHPESMIGYDENSKCLWKQFIKVCKKEMKSEKHG